ncbi:MAG: acyl-ACP--UDP-N-acetylglucosamine O-acyltransferase [Candidatus Omnitrophica bacterium]|nr:acyl-ACP--UDP-N-acetylglucosamine O-acyltransferase [Candidatus Omnitrophota bacterium]
MQIHPTAIVDKDAKIGNNVSIGPYSVIEGGVEIGDDTKLWQNVYVAKGTTIGRKCQIHMGAVLGHEPQDVTFQKKPSYLKIGDGNIIREFVTIHRGTKENSSTKIGDDNFIMGLCHIAHNCELGNKIVMCNSSLLAGYVGVGDMVFMSGNCVVHQFVRIGRLVMVSGSARVGKDVPPFMITERESAIASYNAVGIKRAGLDVETRNEIKKAFTILYLSGLNIKSALEKMESQLNSPEIKHFVEFIRASKKRGVCNYSRRRT